MKIHGAIYVVLGILMAFYARFIGTRVDSSAMDLFFWVGVGFVVFGVFRLIISYVLSDKSSTTKKSSNLENLKAQKTRFESGVGSGKDIVSCPRCGTRHYSTSNFCHMCGVSLR